MVSITTGVKLGSVAIGIFLLIILVRNAGNIGQAVGGFFGGGIRSLGEGLTSGFENIFGGLFPETGGEVNPNLTNDIMVEPPVGTALSFSNFLNRGVISEGFASRFSFLPPTTGKNVLDVSRTFKFLPSLQQGFIQTGGGSKFGGFVNQQAQSDALAKAIEQASSQFPEFFG